MDRTQTIFNLEKRYTHAHMDKDNTTCPFCHYDGGGITGITFITSNDLKTTRIR